MRQHFDNKKLSGQALFGVFLQSLRNLPFIHQTSYIMNQIKLLPSSFVHHTGEADSSLFTFHSSLFLHLLHSGRLRGGLFLFLFLLLHTTSISAQTTDLTTYDVVAKSGNVSIIVKDNDYHMIVGTTKKPKLNMTMGYSKENALSFIDYILDFSNDDYTKKNRNVSMYGMMFFLTITGQGENETFHFVEPGKKVKFALSTKDCIQFKKSIEDHGAGR